MRVTTMKGVIANHVVHNVFIDHVDHSAKDSGYHHHHGEGNNILMHKHNGSYGNHSHGIKDYDGTENDTFYGQAHHVHHIHN